MQAGREMVGDGLTNELGPLRCGEAASYAGTLKRQKKWSLISEVGKEITKKMDLYV